MSAIPSWARVGAKVVCIDDEKATGRFIPASYRGSWDGDLVKGSIYTISAYGKHSAFPDMLCVHVSEAPRKAPFALRRFRPLVTLEDDITTYFADLLDVREPVGA